MRNYIKESLNRAIDDISEPELCRLCESSLLEVIEKIRDAIADDSLDDFMCVEKITEILEKNHFDCGGRHDF